MKKANLTKVQLLQNHLILTLTSIATEEKSIREGKRKKVTPFLIPLRERLLKELLEEIEKENLTKESIWKRILNF